MLRAFVEYRIEALNSLVHYFESLHIVKRESTRRLYLDYDAEFVCSVVVDKQTSLCCIVVTTRRFDENVTK